MFLLLLSFLFIYEEGFIINCSVNRFQMNADLERIVDLVADWLYVPLWTDEVSSTKLMYWWNLLLVVVRRSAAYANHFFQAKVHSEWFNNLHHWFIYPEPNDSRIFDLLRLDSQVRIAVYNEDENSLNFQDIFRLDSKIYINKRERNDFLNKTLNVGLVVRN